MNPKEKTCSVCKKKLTRWEKECLEHDPRRPVCDRCYKMFHALRRGIRDGKFPIEFTD